MAFIRMKNDSTRTMGWLNRLRNRKLAMQVIERYGQKGVDALRDATPVRTGKTANSWSYEVEYKRGVYTLSWNNSNVNDGVNIAVIIETGHGTGTGAYVRGVEYLEPALQPVFDSIADALVKEVTA